MSNGPAGTRCGLKAQCSLERELYSMEHSPTTSGGAEGEEKPAPPPLYTCKEDSIAAALLRQHEVMPIVIEGCE